MDFRLHVFISVAQHLSFTKAAGELHISQPAVSRHIQELESTYKVQLFERTGSKITLTAVGETFLKHAQEIMERYKALQLEMSLLTGHFSSELRVGASTTIAQYVLPRIIARFIALFPDMRFSLLTGNTLQIEEALENHQIDLGFIEGSHRKHSLKYTHFKKDELVLITSTKNKIEEEITLDELSVLPLVLREAGSGTLEVIERKLKTQGKVLAEMNILLHLGSTESIKLFLQNNASVFAIVSIAAVSKELINNELKVIEIKDLSLEREFAFVTTQGAYNEILERFKQFALRTI